MKHAIYSLMRYISGLLTLLLMASLVISGCVSSGDQAFTDSMKTSQATIGQMANDAIAAENAGDHVKAAAIATNISDYTTKESPVFHGMQVSSSYVTARDDYVHHLNNASTGWKAWATSITLTQAGKTAEAASPKRESDTDLAASVDWLNRAKAALPG
jgi:hypothetical protein